VDKIVSFAVLGYGFIGKKHAEIIGNHPKANLKAIIDPIKPIQPVNNYFADLDEFLQAKLIVDVVCVCTPNYLHTQQTKTLLEAGYHVICEKPLGLKLEDVVALKTTEEKTQKKVICVLQNRYSPPIKWLKETISSGILGEIYQIQINCFWNRDDRYYYPNGKKHNWKGTLAKDGGVLFTQFSHFVDILVWCIGDIELIQHHSKNFAHLGKTDFDDTGSIIFQDQHGAIGNLNYSTAVYDQNLESTFTIIAEKGSVKIGGQYMDKVDYCHIKNYKMPTLPPSAPPNDYGHFKGSAQNHGFVIQNAIDFILEGKTIDVGLEEGVKSVKGIEEVI
jgi:UDP-N-acetyl-2-amino-2-deoxyglucuronate dehydrogenase